MASRSGQVLNPPDVYFKFVLDTNFAGVHSKIPSHPGPAGVARGRSDRQTILFCITISDDPYQQTCNSTSVLRHRSHRKMLKTLSDPNELVLFPSTPCGRSEKGCDSPPWWGKGNAQASGSAAGPVSQEAQNFIRTLPWQRDSSSYSIMPQHPTSPQLNHLFPFPSMTTKSGSSGNTRKFVREKLLSERKER